MKRLKVDRRESKAKRLEDSKYLDQDVNEEDIIPKIEIINYDSFSSAIKNNNSILNAVVVNREDDRMNNRNKNKINYSPISVGNKKWKEASMTPKHMASNIKF